MFWVTGTHSHKRIILTSPAKNMLANPDFLNTQNIVEAIQYFGCFKKSLKLTCAFGVSKIYRAVTE